MAPGDPPARDMTAIWRARRMDEQALVARCQQGEQSAFLDLVELHEHEALRLAGQFVARRDIAEDIAAEAFTSAWKHIHRLRPGSPFWPWFYTILVHVAVKEQRRHRREISLEAITAASHEPVSWSGDVTGTEDTVAEREMYDMLEWCLTQLPESYRQALDMRFYQDLSEAEMAAALDCAPGTVKSRLARAKEKLRTLFQRHYGGDRRG